MSTLAVILKKLLSTRPVTWFKIITYIFTFAIGCALMRDCDGCKKPVVAGHSETHSSDTIRVPEKTDTVTIDTGSIRWYPQIKYVDSSGKKVPKEAVCSSFDTATKAGTRVTVQQCYKPILPDSVFRRLIFAPVLTIQDAPAKVITNTTHTYDTIPKLIQAKQKPWSIGPSLGIGITSDGQIKGFAGITVTRGIIHF